MDSNSYMNRMAQSPRSGERLMTPRAGYEFEVEGTRVVRGVAVRADHPIVAANRGAFMQAPEGCEVVGVPERAAKKAAKPSESDED